MNVLDSEQTPVPVASEERINVQNIPPKSIGQRELDETVLTETSTNTLTNKTIDESTNTLTGVVTFTGTQTLTNKTLTSPVIQGSFSGWVTDSGATWTYLSASTITTADGTLFQKGDRIKLTQTTAKYFVVTGVSGNVITVTGGTDYTVANAAITTQQYSHEANPLGYPTTFAYTTTYTGFSSDPTGTVTRFSVLGKMCTIIASDDNSGTSNSTGKTFTAPIANVASRRSAAYGWVINNGTQENGAFVTSGSGTTTIAVYRGPAAGMTWTASGNCRLFVSGITITYEI